MLNGLYPIMIFNFSKLAPDLQAAVSGIPIVSEIVTKIGLPPIPIYLSEDLTGLVIDSEDKNIDIQTEAETLADGGDPVTNQKGIASTVTVNMKGNRNSIGLTLIASMADLIFSKVTSKEYSITYMNGAITVFNGLLNSFQITQNIENDLYNISFQLSRNSSKIAPSTGIPVVDKVTGVLPL